MGCAAGWAEMVCGPMYVILQNDIPAFLRRAAEPPFIRRLPAATIVGRALVERVVVPIWRTSRRGCRVSR